MSNSVLEQSKIEYALSEIIKKVFIERKKVKGNEKNVNMTISGMRKFRDSLNFDSSKDKITKNKSTGHIKIFHDMADNVERTSPKVISLLKNDDDMLKNLVSLGKDFNSFTNRFDKKRYIVSALDPSAYDLFNINTGTSTLYTIDKDFRELKEGESITLYNKSSHVSVNDVRLSNNKFILEVPKNKVVYRESGNKSIVYEEPNIDTYDYFVGWDTQGEKVGLSSVWGVYFSNKDQIELKKAFNNKVINKREDIFEINKTTAYLKELRSRGIDFDFNSYSEGRGLELTLKMGSKKPKVILFNDSLNPQGFGGISFSDRSYSHRYTNNIVPNVFDWNLKDAFRPLDYFTDRIEVGTYQSKGGLSNFGDKFRHNNKNLYIKNFDSSFNLPVYQRKSSDYIKYDIESTISIANQIFDEEFNFNDLVSFVKNSDLENISSEDREIIDEKNIEDLYSSDLFIKGLQESFVDDLYKIKDAVFENIIDEFDSSTLTSISDKSFLDDSEISISSLLENPEILFNAMKDENIGSYDTGINVSNVANLSSSVISRSQDKIINALNHLNYNTDLIKGNSFAKSVVLGKMIRYDELSAIRIKDSESEFMRNIGKTVEENLRKNGILPTIDNKEYDIKIDSNGILRWEGLRQFTIGSLYNKVDDYKLISGEIGQIFEPDKNGIITTRFGGDHNFSFIPGYVGRFDFNIDSNNRKDTFRVKGFEQIINSNLAFTIKDQCTRKIPTSRNKNIVYDNIEMDFDHVSLNNVYRTDTYGRRISLDFFNETNLKPEVAKSIVDTLSRRVKFEAQYEAYCTTFAENRYDALKESNPFENENEINENSADYLYWKSAGSKNMRVLDSDMENVIDMNVTGNATNQGVTWYLTEGAVVNADGSVTESKDLYNEKGKLIPDKTPLMKLPYFKNSEFTSWGRIQMAAHQLMTAERVDEKVGFALMDFGGWTFDDSYAVSKDFAERNSVRDGNGNLRPLKRGDKISDFGGNKGTIGIVIDRDMDIEVAKKEDLYREVMMFKENPKLDVVGAAYSPISRHNGGIIRDAMENERYDLYDPVEDKTYKSAIGQANIIVTDLTIDKKTVLYGDDMFKKGRGRMASGQLAWALQSKDAQATLKSIYGNNIKAFNSLREYLISTGYDMGVDGVISKGYKPHKDEVRKVFKYDPNVREEDFLKSIKSSGGFLEIPFNVTFKNGVSTNKIPILSSTLRRETALLDESFMENKTTTKYTQIYSALETYNVYMDKINKLESGNKKVKDHNGLIEKYKKEVNSSVKSINTNFKSIEGEILSRKIRGIGANGKYSFIRDNIMGKKIKNSGTLVAIVDPRLKIREASVSSSVLNELNAKENSHVMIWRDPVVRDGAIRSKILKRDDSVFGIAFNPVTDKSHNGDFDGDSYGCFKPNREAINEIDDKFGFHNNLIDKGAIDKPLYFQLGMDIKSAMYKARENGVTELDDLYSKIENNSLSSDEKVRKQVVRNLDTLVNKCFREYGFGSSYVDFTDYTTVANSFSSMVNKGAKGSPSKLLDLFDYTGIEVDRTNFEEDVKNNSIKILDVKDESLLGDQERMNVQYANGVKTDLTGIAGSIAQKTVSALRNYDIETALEIGYPVTESTIQIKNNAEMAKKTSKILNPFNGPLANLYSGKSSDGKTDNIPKSRFIAEMTTVLNKDLGLNVASEYVERLGDCLSDESGYMQSINSVIENRGSAMDRIAYGGLDIALNNIADENINLPENEKISLFEGKYNNLFVPNDLRENKIVSLVSDDVIDDSLAISSYQEDEKLSKFDEIKRNPSEEIMNIIDEEIDDINKSSEKESDEEELDF